MADTARAVKIANERIRPMADRLGQTYFASRNLLTLSVADGWMALFDQFSQKVPLPDGSAEDGRSPITPETVKALIVSMQAYVDFMDANAGALRTLVLAAAVNPERL